METCTVETGLLKKKPCGHNMVTRCANCEQPLCKDHAIAMKNDAGKTTGKFMCKECTAAHKEIAKNPPPAMAKKPAEAPKPAQGAPAPAAAAAKAAAAPGAKPAAAPATATAAANKMDESGPIEFTPTKK